MLQNRFNKHLAQIDRNSETDNGYQESHAFNQEQEKLQEFTSVDKTVCGNEPNYHDSMTVTGNKYLTSDFDIRRGGNCAFKTGLNLRLRNNKHEMLNRAVDMELWSKMSDVKTRRKSSSDIYSSVLREKPSSSTSQSDFFQNLYKKYPQAFQYKSPNHRGLRPGRRLFSSGVRLNYEDDTSSLGDTGSVHSERPYSKWEQEITDMLGTKFGLERGCVTSPTPSMVSDASVQDRLHATSESLKHLLQHRKYHRSKLVSDVEQRLRRSSIVSEISENDSPLSDLDKELEYREQMLQSISRKNIGNQKTDYNQNQRQCSNKPSHWRVHSPESPPDSAIDVDSSSLQSAGSLERKTEPTYDLQSKDTHQVSHDQIPRAGNKLKVYGAEHQRRQGKILVRKGVVHKDSDVDSGIVPTSVNDEVPADPPSYNTTMSSRTQTVALSVKQDRGQRSRPSPIKADHSLALNLNQSNQEEDDSIAQEILTAQMSTDLLFSPQKNRPGGKVHFEDEVDDTDPRLGIPAVTGEEKKIAERYRRRRSPMPFVVHRNCATSRDERPKTNSANRPSRSDNHVSVLCTPRKQPINKSEFKHCNGDLHKFGSQQTLHSKPEERLRPTEKYSVCFSSQPNLSVIGKHINKHTETKQQKQNIKCMTTTSQQKSLHKSSFPSENWLLLSDTADGAKHFNGSKSLSKSQPNLSPCVEISTKGRPSISRTSSSKSDRSSASSQLALYTDPMLDTVHNRNQDVPFTAKNPRKNKIHFKKYFKAKRGKYIRSLEEHCFGGELSHGTSMPDLSGKHYDKIVQYPKVSKHRSMQNIYFQSNKSDTDSDGEEVKSRPSKPSRSGYLPNSGAIRNKKFRDSLTDRDSGLDTKMTKKEGHFRTKESFSSMDSKSSNSESLNQSNSANRPRKQVLTESYPRTGSKKLTPYESSVEHLDKHGLNVNDLIESDSDSFSAKCVVIDKIANEKDIHVHSLPNMAPKKEQAKEISDIAFHPHERRYRKKGDNQLNMDRQPNTVLTDQNQNLRGYVDGHQVLPMIHHDNPSIGAKHSRDQERTSVSSSVSSVSPSDQMPIYDEKPREVPHNKGDSSDRTSFDQRPFHGEKHREVQNCKADNSDRTYVVQRKQSTESDEIQSHVYAEVNLLMAKKQVNEGRQLSNKLSSSTPNIAANFDRCVDIDIDDSPELPDRGYIGETNLVKTKELSASRQSLSDKMGNIKKSAKNKFKAIRKAVSMDKGIDAVGNDDHPKVKDKKKSKGKRGFFGLFSKKKSKQKTDHEVESGCVEPTVDTATSNLHYKWASCDSIDSIQDENKGCRLCKMNSDGTQVVEIRKPQNKAIDFFVSRGNSQFKHGVFVSRFIDKKNNRYSGLLSVGDEIIEVNGFKVHDLLLDDVYGLLSNSEKLVITILPLLARQDI